MANGQVVYAVAVFFGGAASIAGLVFLVYVISYIADSFSNPGLLLTTEEQEERRMASSLIRKAGIAGILPKERIRIFRHFFKTRTFLYQKDVKETNIDDEEDDVDASTEVEQKNMVESSESEVSTDTETLQSETGEVGTKKVTPNLGEDGAGVTCSICLSDYVDGDKVITGTACNHVFHYECCMQWVEKKNEHCPYCRTIFLTPEELVQAARQEIGQKRVDKLIRVNQDAAQKIAASQMVTPPRAADGTVGNSTNLYERVPSTQSPSPTEESGVAQQSSGVGPALEMVAIETC